MSVAEPSFPREKRKRLSMANRLPASAGEFSFTTPRQESIEERFLKKFSQVSMKKLFFLPLLALFVAVVAAVWFYFNAQPVSNNNNFSFFVINKGSSVSVIGDKLQSSGFVKSALAFKLYIRFTGQTGRLQPGEFRLTPSFSLFQISETLFKGPVELWVTIPEGLRREEVAARFATGLDRDNSFINEFLSDSKGDEGYLFPDTYLFPMDASPAAVIKKMTDTFTAKTQGFTPQGSNLTFSQSVIIASLLERETKTDAERPIVAGIILNRIKLGMPLQIDASVQYAVGTPSNWWPILTLNDLKTSSPYNTYKYTGLPPAPIANPGLSSLKAALSPAQTDYLYYIHDPSGQIHFAKTLAEQNANIAKYLGK